MGFFKKLVKGVGKVVKAVGKTVGGVVSTAATLVGQTGILPGSKLIASAGGIAGKLLSGSSSSPPSPQAQQQAQAGSFTQLQTGATVQPGPASSLVFGEKTDSAIGDFFKKEKPWYVWVGIGLGALLVPLVIFKMFFSRKRR